MKLAVVAAVALVPAAALAQVPVNPGAPDAPTTLSPGQSGNQTPAPPPQPKQGPGVVIIGPDGKVLSGDSAPAAPGGVYIPSGGGDQPVDNPQDVYTGGQVPELHVVRKGDTLWDICFYYFADPWQWPKIWSYNPQITNPHWIYPGDLVRLLPRGVFTSTEPEGGNPPDTSNQPPDNVPPPARRTDVGLKSVAFVEKNDLDKSVTIDGSVEAKQLLGVNDEVYLSYPEGKPPEVGKTYSVYLPGRQVKQNGKDFGSYVEVLGRVKVTSVKQDKRARGVITEANREIERGSKVGPLVREFKNVPPVPPKVDLQAPIVAMLTKDQLIGQGEVVFIAAGKGTGIEIGNRMFVVRRGDAYPANMKPGTGQDDRRFPARALGEIVIVDVGDKISIGLVTLSVQEMSIGDQAMMQKAK